MTKVEKHKKEKNNSFTVETYLAKRYLSPARMSSYATQIIEVINTFPEYILEVGIGSGYLANELKKRGLKVMTLDNNKLLNPDVVADVTKMPFVDSQFDTTICCEVLEHISYSEFIPALREIGRVTKKYVLLTLPDVSSRNKIDICFFGKRIVSIPKKPSKIQDDHSHFWEIGRKGYPINRIRVCIKKAGFEIEKEYAIINNKYHKLFLLKK